MSSSSVDWHCPGTIGLLSPVAQACLAEYFEAWRERDAALDQLKFLVEVHGLARVVLVAHEGCAFIRSAFASRRWV